MDMPTFTEHEKELKCAQEFEGTAQSAEELECSDTDADDTQHPVDDAPSKRATILFDVASRELKGMQEERARTVDPSLRLAADRQAVVLERLETASQLGHVEASALLGQLYLEGLEVEGNTSAGLGYLHLAALDDFKDSRKVLAAVLMQLLRTAQRADVEDDDGEDGDDADAAAKRVTLDGCRSRGTDRVLGASFVALGSEVAGWLRADAEEGDATSMLLLHECLLHGWLMDADAREAATWRARALACGDNDAIYKDAMAMLLDVYKDFQAKTRAMPTQIPVPVQAEPVDVAAAPARSRQTKPKHKRKHKSTPMSTPQSEAADASSAASAAASAGASPEALKALEFLRATSSAAIARLRETAYKGHAPSQLTLGMLMVQGLFVDEDPSGAAAEYARATENGCSTAPFLLAQLYGKGLGVPQCQDTALALARTAVLRGNAQALPWYNALRNERVPEVEAARKAERKDAALVQQTHSAHIRDVVKSLRDAEREREQDAQRT